MSSLLFFIFYFIYLVYSKRITTLYPFSKYSIIKDQVYLYNTNYESNILNFQCEQSIKLYCFDDENSAKKRFNGSYADYINSIESNNIIFNLNDIKKSGKYYFISDYSSSCSFFSNNEEYIINGNENNDYYLYISYKILFPLKILFKNFVQTKYINIQFKNYINFWFYENDKKLESIDEKNSYIKLIPDNNYYITFNNDKDFIFSIKVQLTEIIELSFNELNLNIINPGIYYFFTRRGFNKGGIKIKNGSFSHILCKKIEDVENIRDINYTKLLKDTYDCIINKDLIEYPILEDNSYFIFSAKLYSDPNLYLYKEEEKKEEEEDESYNKNNNNKEHQDQQSKESNNKNKNYEKDEGFQLLKFIVYMFLFMFTLLGLICICECCKSLGQCCSNSLSD